MVHVALPTLDDRAKVPVKGAMAVGPGGEVVPVVVEVEVAVPRSMPAFW